MSERIIVDLDRAGKLESEIEKKLQSGQSIGSVMDESLAVVKNEIFQTEELGGSATIDVDSIVDGSTSSYTGATTTNKKVIAKQNTEEVVLDDIDYDASFRKMRDHKVDTINLVENVLHKYRSFNTIWSMFCLTPEEMADPDNTYMTSEPQTVLIRGAGGIGNYQSERRPKTR